MQKRNFTLLIIFLSIILLAFFGFLYFKRAPNGQEDGEGSNFLSHFNPFGSLGNKPAGDDTTPPPIDVSDDGEDDEEPLQNLNLMKVSSVPVAGFGIFLKERYKEVPLPPADPADAAPATNPAPPQKEFAPAVRYADRATGNIFQTFADDIAERKFSATLIPKAYEAFFGNSAQAVVLRYLKGGPNIETFLGKLPPEILGGDSLSEVELRGTFLPPNVTDLSVSPDGKRAFYLYNSGEVAVGTVLDFATEKKTQVFDSAFSEWLSAWPAGNVITLTTKPSYLAPGYMYKMSADGRGFAQVLDGILGLTTLPGPDGKTILYADNTLSLRLYHADTKTSEALGVRTLPEKCVWDKGGSAIYCAAPKFAPGANYPDVWYQGEISFDDQIWKIDPVAGSASIMLDPAGTPGGSAIDGWKLALDPNEKYLFFVNKKDSFLWRLTLK